MSINQETANFYLKDVEKSRNVSSSNQASNQTSNYNSSRYSQNVVKKVKSGLNLANEVNK